MKDANGETVKLGDTLLIPIEGEMMLDPKTLQPVFEKAICLAHKVVAALEDPDGNLIPYQQEAGFLLK